MCGLTILPCLSIQLKEAKVFLKRKKCLYRGNISRSNDKWPESCAPFYRMTRSCYERRHRSLFELQGLGWHLHTVRLPAMLGHAAHTQKGEFWLFIFLFQFFFLSALICRFPLRVLSLSLLATSWWNAHHTRKVIEFEHSTIYPLLLPPFDALILLATCWDRAFTFPWVPNETVEGVSPASTSSWSGLNTRGAGGDWGGLHGNDESSRCDLSPRPPSHLSFHPSSCLDIFQRVFSLHSGPFSDLRDEKFVFSIVYVHYVYIGDSFFKDMFCPEKTNDHSSEYWERISTAALIKRRRRTLIYSTATIVEIESFIIHSGESISIALPGTLFLFFFFFSLFSLFSLLLSVDLFTSFA